MAATPFAGGRDHRGSGWPGSVAARPARSRSALLRRLSAAGCYAGCTAYRAGPRGGPAGGGRSEVLRSAAAWRTAPGLDGPGRAGAILSGGSPQAHAGGARGWFAAWRSCGAVTAGPAGAGRDGGGRLTCSATSGGTVAGPRRAPHCRGRGAAGRAGRPGLDRGRAYDRIANMASRPAGAWACAERWAGPARRPDRNDLGADAQAGSCRQPAWARFAAKTGRPGPGRGRPDLPGRREAPGRRARRTGAGRPRRRAVWAARVAFRCRYQPRRRHPCR